MMYVQCVKRGAWWHLNYGSLLPYPIRRLTRTYARSSILLTLLLLLTTTTTTPIPFLCYHPCHFPAQLVAGTSRRFYPQRSSRQAMVTGVVSSPPPRYVPPFVIAHRKQSSHCSSILHQVLLELTLSRFPQQNSM